MENYSNPIYLWSEGEYIDFVKGRVFIIVLNIKRKTKFNKINKAEDRIG